MTTTIAGTSGNYFEVHAKTIVYKFRVRLPTGEEQLNTVSCQLFKRTYARGDHLRILQRTNIGEKQLNYYLPEVNMRIQT